MGRDGDKDAKQGEKETARTRGQRHECRTSSRLKVMLLLEARREQLVVRERHPIVKYAGELMCVV